MSRSVFIIAGESSGEIYGARLALRLSEKWPGIRIMGVGGLRMKEAGVELVAGITNAIGLVEVLRKLGEIKRSLDMTVAAIERERPDVLVLIDYPDFNFRVARRVREMGIRILYYVTPQVWAWRKGRLRQMAKFVDRAAVILPFEEKVLKDAGIDAEFVGHPIAEEMEGSVPPKLDAKSILGLDTEKPYLAILPGSRDSELERLLPVLLRTVQRLAPELPGYGFILSIAPNIEAERYSDLISMFRELGVHVTGEDIAMVYAASEAAVVASGTAAFQAVFTETPIAVIYKVSPVTYFIMRRLVDLEYYNLANLILGREAVKELIQDEAEPERIADELRGLVSDNERSMKVKRDLATVRSMFSDRHPTERVADIIGEMAGWQA
ncbi:lipid-A-disaccharide synthase [Nitrospirota bacterium]